MLIFLEGAAVYYSSDGSGIAFNAEVLITPDAIHLTCAVTQPGNLLQCDDQDTFCICKVGPVVASWVVRHLIPTA